MIKREHLVPEKEFQNDRKYLPKIKIDVNCKEYAMLFAGDVNRPKKRASRGRSSKSKSKTPASVDINLKLSDRNLITAAPARVIGPTISRRGSFRRKGSEALLSINKIPEPIATASSSNTKDLDITRAKRKRFVDDHDIAAENIPVEAVFPALQFGINKDLCPQKRRRLQNLITSKRPI